jgi:tetratricopeptide (TPR) repeat protein
MEKYLMQRNMVYQLLPVEIENQKSQMDGFRKNMNTDIQYNLLINEKEKFTYGGVERGKRIYIDPSGYGSILTTKYLNYLELAKSLNDERLYLEAQASQMMKDSLNAEFAEVGRGLQQQSREKKDKAIATLDRMIELFPDSSVPYDNNMINVAQLYYQLGQQEKALNIIKTMSDRNISELEYFYKMANLSDFTAEMFSVDTRQAESAVYLSIDLAEKCGDAQFSEMVQAKWEALRAKYALPSLDEGDAQAPN